jgi:uncharacterized membrane protein
MTVGSNRMLGFVGALLTALGSVSQFLALQQYIYPFATLSFNGFGILFGILGFIGFILFMIAMYGLSKDYGDSSIFNNALYAILSGIIGGLATAAVAIAIVFSHLGSIVSSINPTNFSSTSIAEIVQNFIGYLTPILIVASIVALIPAWFYMRAFSRLASKSEVRLFRTAGLLLIIGAVVNVVMACIGVLLVLAASVPASVVLYMPVVGGVVSFVAWIFATDAFYSMKSQTKERLSTLIPQSYASAGEQVRYCPYCGTQNRADAAYCKQCGKRL